MESQYQEALIAEIRAHAWEWKPDTLYLGGGTPSLIDPTPILAALPGKPWREATIEAAPGTLHINSWRAGGSNRVSLGVQSFLAHRSCAGPVAGTPPKRSFSEVAMLRAAGFENINIDLIAGLPVQTEASWRESLDWIERLAPPHVSVYMLEVDEDSRLGAEILLGGKRYGATDDAFRTTLTADFTKSPSNGWRRWGFALRDLQLRPSRLRIAAQLEILAAGTLRRLWRRRTLLRWRMRAGKIPNRLKITSRAAARANADARQPG